MLYYKVNRDIFLFDSCFVIHNHDTGFWTLKIIYFHLILTNHSSKQRLISFSSCGWFLIVINFMIMNTMTTFALSFNEILHVSLILIPNLRKQSVEKVVHGSDSNMLFWSFLSMYDELYIQCVTVLYSIL